MNILESISLAFNSLRVYKLRATLTLLSIAIGVFAIMGSGTLIESINGAVTGELANLGENSFIFHRLPAIQMGNTWRQYMKRKPITYSQFKDLKKQITITDEISCQSASGGKKIRAGNLETDPDVTLIGSDELYFRMNNTYTSLGRPLMREDIELNRNVVVIGNDVVVKIFPHINPIGKKIRIKNQSFTVIGVMEKKGALLGQSQDNQVIIPVTIFLRYFASWWQESLNIVVRAPNKMALDPTLDQAIGAMRSIRNVKPWENNSFEISTSESLSQQFAQFTVYLSVFGVATGLIALFAAGVGIMNIMLVSVKERTREIGVRKAVGAKRSWVMTQFIIEAITLCQIGGLVGVLFGVCGAWLLTTLFEISIVFSLFWFLTSLIICTVLGIIFGAYPAWKAATLDPIDALRYE